MSDYAYERRGSRRSGRPRSPEYIQETYVERGYGPQELVYREREESIEDIPRDFPPPGYSRQRARSVGRHQYDEPNPYYSQAQYSRRNSRAYDRDGYYSDDYDRPRTGRRKSIVDQVKEVGEKFGLGGVIGAVSGNRGRSRSESRPRGDMRDRSRSRDVDKRRTEKKWEQAAKAAIVAGAVEAFRSRKEPGKWTGDKGQRVATAALGAAGLDGFLDKDPNKKEKRHIAEAALGGLVANRVANGPRSRSRGRDDDRSRSRSRSRSQSRIRSLLGRDRSESRGRSRDDKNHTVRDVAGAGAAIAAGKAIYDRLRSKSRSRKDRADSVSSEDSYVPSRGRHYKDDRRRSRSRSVGGRDGGSDMRRRDSSVSSTSTTDYEKQRRKMRGKELLTAGLATVATIHAAHGVYSSMEASEKRRKLVSEGEMTAEEARKRRSKNMLQDAAAIGIAALGIKGAFSEWKEMNEKRHTVRELATKRDKRRKARERRQRELREQQQQLPGPQNQLALNTRNNAMANPYGGYSGGSMPYGQMTYADANPYSAVPPPPMGGMRY